MKFFRYQLIVLLTAASILNAKAEPPGINANSTLPDLIRHALANNAGLKAAYQTWQAKLLKIPQVTALPDPRLSYGHFLRSVETRVGPQNHKFGIAQVFPWFGKLKLRGDHAEQEAEVVLQQLESKRQQIVFEVRDTFHEYAYLHRAIEIVDENISLLKQLEGVAQVKFKGGGEYLGVVKAQVELGKLTDRKETLADLLEPVGARLNAALGRGFNAALPRPVVAPVPPLAHDDQKLLAQLAEHNPQLKALSADIERSDRSIALARKNFRPDVTVSVDYIQTGDAIAAATPGNSKDAVMAGFSINIPLWWKKLRSGVKEAEANKKAAIAQRENAENELVTRLKFAHFKYRDAERKIALYRDSLVPQAMSALTVAQKAFEGGSADFLETVDAQRLLLEFQLQAERSAANREQRLAEIHMILGTGGVK